MISKSIKSENQRPRIIGLITARGGSKGIPRKNIINVRGKPLIAWTIEAAKNADCIDEVILSSDDEDIIEIAKVWGCKVPFRRPKRLATDIARSVDVVIHAIKEIPGFDYVILLQPTSPLRTAEDIDAAFQKMLLHDAPSCVSVRLVDDSPHLMYRLEDEKLKSLLSSDIVIERRQDLPLYYILNGAIYIAKIDWLLKVKRFITSETVAYVMKNENSIDVDTYEDINKLNILHKSSNC